MKEHVLVVNEIIDKRPQIMMEYKNTSLIVSCNQITESFSLTPKKLVSV